MFVEDSKYTRWWHEGHKSSSSRCILFIRLTLPIFKLFKLDFLKFCIKVVESKRIAVVWTIALCISCFGSAATRWNCLHRSEMQKCASCRCWKILRVKKQFDLKVICALRIRTISNVQNDQLHMLYIFISCFYVYLVAYF